MKIRLTIILAILHFVTYASIICPDDRTITCDMDIHNLDMLGEPTAFGSHAGAPFSYVDEDLRSTCGVGTINRTWFINLNNTGLPEGNPSCIQHIYVEQVDGFVFNIKWPRHEDLSCVEDVEFNAPEITHGPCEQVGYTYEDTVFELEEDACYKLLREFTVMNWCEIEDNDPTTIGIYRYTQIIKVTEHEAPVISNCEDVEVAMTDACLAEVTLTNSANDLGDCPSSELYWTVRVDLNWDFVYEYEYSYFLQGDQHLDPVTNGADLNITLPELVEAGTHGVEYSVQDACGNVAKCTTKLKVVDRKAPTPYCHLFLTAAFDADAMPAMIPVSLFDRGATDNCTPQERIRLSFSQDVNDTLKVITCGNQGFQFYRIYATDEAGNQDFCEVFMLIFDNDGCGFRYAPTGKVLTMGGMPVMDQAFIMMDGAEEKYMAYSTEDGSFVFDDTELMNDMKIMAKTQDATSFEANILHLKRMQDHMLGLEPYTESVEYFMADINADQKINAQDLLSMRDHLLGKDILPASTWIKYVEEESMDESWKDFNQEIVYGDYDGQFDFVQLTFDEVFAQDADDATLQQEARVSTVEDQTTYSLIADESVVSEGVSCKAQLPTDLLDDDITIYLAGNRIHADEYTYDSNTGVLNVLKLGDIELQAGTAWLEIQLAKEALISSVDASIIVEDQLVSINNRDQVSEDIAISEDKILHSNLVTDQLVLRPHVYQSGSLTIIDRLGQILWQGTAEANVLTPATPGLYWILWEHEGSQSIEKFVKQ